jgi:pyruvate,orthophosphate dikinase
VKVKSKALEINLADYHVDVAIDEKYSILQEVLSKYYGLTEGLNTLLKELCHPYKNWRFIVSETRKYSLEYFHLIKNHPKGPDAASLLIDIFINAIESDIEFDVKIDAVDNLMLLLQKIVKDSGPDLDKFLPNINSAFLRMLGLSDELFGLFTRSYYQINRLADNFLNQDPKSDGVIHSVNQLVARFLHFTYSYWLSEKDPRSWFEKEVSEIDPQDSYEEFFKNISHQQLENWNHQLDHIQNRQNLKPDEVLTSLLKFPGFHQIAAEYRQIPLALLKKGGKDGRGRHLKLIFLFHIMSIDGLSLIHEEALRGINRTIGWIIGHENYRYIQNLIQKTFSILKEQADVYPATALNCVLNMGKGVYETDEIDLINYFIDSVIDLGFAAPNIQGVSNEWQIQVSKTHILNIRT